LEKANRKKNQNPMDTVAGLQKQAHEAYIYAKQLKPELQPAADQELDLIK
jgi:hypothetical protein